MDIEEMVALAAMEDDVQSVCGHCGRKTRNSFTVFVKGGLQAYRRLCDECIQLILEWL